MHRVRCNAAVVIYVRIAENSHELNIPATD